MLDNQGFVVSAKSAKDGVNTTSKHVRSHGTNAASSKAEKGAIIANDAVGILHKHPEESDNRAIARAQKIERTADKLWTAEMFAMMGGMGLGAVSRWTKNEHLDKASKAINYPFKKLRETQLNQVLPESVNTQLGTTMQPVKDSVKAGLGAFEGTVVGKPVVDGLQKVSTWRAEANTSKHIKQLGKAEAALTQNPPGFFGFIDDIKNFITRSKPKPIPAHEGLGEATKHLANARSAATTADRLMHMENAKKSLVKIAETSEGELAQRAGHVLKYVEKSAASAGMAHHFSAAETQGLAGIVKAAGKAVGRVPVFGAIMGIGMTAGLSAIVMTHRKENREAKQARDEIAAAIGENSVLMQSIDEAYHKNKRNHLTKSGLTSVSTIANGMMAASSTAGGMGYMAASMLPAGVSAFVKEDMTLNAYANLRHEETSGQKLPPEAKLAMIRQLVASVPAVAKAGGIYNKLTMPVAEAIQDQNLSAQDTMKLLSNETKFSELATQVMEKQKAAQAAVAQAAPETNRAPTKAAPMIGGKASVHGIVNEGRVSHLQKAASV